MIFTIGDLPPDEELLFEYDRNYREFALFILGVL